jgi:DNA invertase Pin-like site-specific DNA recombinase
LVVINNSNKKFRKGTHLIVESLDRLSRNAMTQALTLFLNLITSGVVIHSLAEGQVYSEKEINESPFIISLAIAVLMRGWDESLTKKYRTADNMERNLKLARTEKTPIARPPSRIDTVGKRNNKRFILNRHAATVKRIFEEAAAGLTVHEICRGLNADNVKTFGRSTHWGKGTVSRILMRSDAAIGVYKPHTYLKVKGKKKQHVPLDVPPIEDYFPPVVSLSLFQRARENIRGRFNPRTRGYTGPIYQNLLKGLVTCGRCCGQVHHRNAGNPKSNGDSRGGPHLFCYNTVVGNPDGEKCAPTVLFPYDKLEPLLFRIYELYEATMGLFQLDASDTAERIAKLELTVERLNTERKNLLRAFAGKGDKAGEEVLADNWAEITAAQEKLDNLKIDYVRTIEGVEQAHHDQFRENMKRIEAEDQEEKRKARMALSSEFRRIIDTVILNPDRTLTMRIKPTGSNVAFGYLISPDQIERVTLIRDGEVVETLEIGDMLVSQAQNKEDLAAIIERHMFARSGIQDVPLSEFVRIGSPCHHHQRSRR